MQKNMQSEIQMRIEVNGVVTRSFTHLGMGRT